MPQHLERGAPETGVCAHATWVDTAGDGCRVCGLPSGGQPVAGEGVGAGGGLVVQHALIAGPGIARGGHVSIDMPRVPEAVIARREVS